MENKKIGLLKTEDMGQYELEQGFASYSTIVERYIGDIVLCNNIIDVDYSIYDNMNSNAYRYINTETGEEVTQEYYNNNEDKCDIENVDIYQYFLCNLNEYDCEMLEKMGIILSYSNKLECDVLCVEHVGTAWSGVLTDVKLFDTYEELKSYEESEAE